jgi:hypothetical protein
MELYTKFEFAHNATIVLQPTFDDYYVNKIDNIFAAISGLTGNGLPNECYILAIHNNNDFVSVNVENEEFDSPGWTKGEK